MAELSGRDNVGGLDEGGLPIRMLHDRVLVSTDGEPGERRSSGGIVIPATVAIGRRLAWGEVVAVGTHVRTVKPKIACCSTPRTVPRSRSEARTTCCSGSGICTPSPPSGSRTGKPASTCESLFPERGHSVLAASITNLNVP